MLKVCITGSIGSGKSTVSEIFIKLGIPLFNADEEAKKLFSNQVVKEKILKVLGDEVFDGAGEIDKRTMASLVFNDKESLKSINSIIHPLVMKCFENWTGNHKNAVYVILESAIIYESLLEGNFDKIITVSAPFDLRVKRVINRDRISRDDVCQRIRNQWTDEQKVKLADFVIYNDGRQMIIPQVLNIDNELRSNVKNTSTSD